jgi:hypothetical protein
VLQAREEPDQDQGVTMNAGIVERQATGQMNAEVEEAATWTETGTEVGQDAEVTLVIEEGPLQEAEDQAVVIQETMTGEKAGVSAVRREATSGRTAQATRVAVEILVMGTGEEMTVGPPMVATEPEMLLVEETPQEADHHP